MSNRLARSQSPYLQQHADNPVDWYEWGAEAFEAARERGVPILLSIGYAACHWCHVMAHESFEDEATAALMNAGFVNVKVDREERPDVDAVYMEATQAFNGGQGGWPMTCLLTPAGDPLFCGTYLPRAQFQGLLGNVTEAWTSDREAIEEQGADISRQLREQFGGAIGAGLAPDPAVLDAAVEAMTTEFDHRFAGFGRAPKFPPSMLLEFLLRAYARAGDPRALEMVERTCEAMARGGMYDQLAGGFARYSVDSAWVVPHFEKMLYDNALLLRPYLHWWRTSGDPLAERVVRETIAFLLRELRTPQGGFASSLDADAAGVEGLTYVWTPQELTSVLGTEDAAWVSHLCVVTPDGTFEEGASTLQLAVDPDDLERWEDVRTKLLAVRAKRPQPGRDDKVVAAWNGWAISALAEAGALLQEPSWVTAAEEAAALLRDLHLTGGRLRRVSRDGTVGAAAAVLEDYGAVAAGWMSLYQVNGDVSWLDSAGELLDIALREFPDGTGGFFDSVATADDGIALLRRPQDPTDNATPSGASALTGALVTYSALTGKLDYREAAETALAKIVPLIGKHPRFAGEAAAVAEAIVAGPVEIAVVNRPDLELLARMSPSPGAVVVTS
ncbi:MAG: N-acylglucosamine 2-epimerase, partial [Mycobacterium sp.]|nr:N-acylglucosamine 2-epimerase [Mycobacterium sp.]